VLVQLAGTSIEWISQSQSNVAQSTFTAELAALTSATEEAKFYRLLMGELGLGTRAPTRVRSDNAAAVLFANAEQYVGKAKSLPIKFFAVREAVEAGDVDVTHVPSASNLGDAFTKSLSRPTFVKFRDLMGVGKPPA
jgi:hypothetical protein